LPYLGGAADENWLKVAKKHEKKKEKAGFSTPVKRKRMSTGGYPVARAPMQGAMLNPYAQYHFSPQSQLWMPNSPSAGPVLIVWIRKENSFPNHSNLLTFFRHL